MFENIILQRREVVVSGDGNLFYRADAHRKDKISDELNHKEIPNLSDSLFEKNPKIFGLQFHFLNSLKVPVKKIKITGKKTDTVWLSYSSAIYMFSFSKFRDHYTMSNSQ